MKEREELIKQQEEYEESLLKKYQEMNDGYLEEKKYVDLCAKHQEMDDWYRSEYDGGKFYNKIPKNPLNCSLLEFQKGLSGDQRNKVLELMKL